VRFRTLRVPVPGLPGELAGVRIVHLSDFHLGMPSRGVNAVVRAVAWARARDPDLVVLSGDLLSRRRGEHLLRELVDGLPRAYAILGNHDLAISRDPFAERTALGGLEGVTLLSDEGRTLSLRGRRVYVAGSDPRARFVRTRVQPGQLARSDADLKILLLHYPKEAEKLPEGAFDLVLAGHMHDGQICVPYPGGKLLLAHPTARYRRGLYRVQGAAMHVSPGLGTTFVPFRFFARPEATELVLEPAPPAARPSTLTV
jgi:uncharacterized protein